MQSASEFKNISASKTISIIGIQLRKKDQKWCPKSTEQYSVTHMI